MVNLALLAILCLLQIYLTELEKVPEFGGFKCHETFPLCRGKQNEEEEDAGLRTAGKFKVSTRYLIIVKGKQSHGFWPMHL